MLLSNPLPNYFVSPIFLWQSWCIEYEASTHHVMIYRVPSCSIRCIYIVQRIYLRRRFNFPQSSSYVSCTLVVRESMVVCISLCYLGVTDRSLSTAWLNAVILFFYNSTRYLSVLTSNKCYAAKVFSLPCISSGNSSMTLLRRGVIFITTSPGNVKSMSIPR